MKFATATLATSAKTSTTMTIAAMTKKAVEHSILCSDGIRVAYQHFPIVDATTQKTTGYDNATKEEDPCPILCLHGWLDNAASFHLLAPYLSSQLRAAGFNDTGGSKGSEEDNKTQKERIHGQGTPSHPGIFVIDLPGHGLSSHKSSDGPPQLLSEYAYYIAEVASALSWNKFDIVGHSMGAGVAVVYAAAFPEHVRRMVLLEGGGPLAKNASDCSRHVRAACDRRIRSNKLLYPNGNDNKRESSARLYPNIGAAIAARLNTVSRFPGSQYLSEQAAHAMVARATIPIPEKASTAQGNDVPVTFRHDPRLQWPSLQYFTREQVDSLYNDISCPICLLTAEDGWPFDRRSQDSVENILKPVQMKVLPGSHHFHADPDTADAVASETLSFLRD